jgi:5-(carboxyamino)imidazole ribonucleotide mutase
MAKAPRTSERKRRRPSAGDVKAPLVGIIMGSDSDLETMRAAAAALAALDVPHEMRILSAHRTPDDLADYAKTARARGLRVIVAGAGGAAHLPGVTAAYTTLPVIGVPMLTRALGGLDSLFAIVQMPAGVPVATVGIGNARNAGLLAAQILATSDPALHTRLEAFRRAQAQAARDKNARLPRP